MNNKVTLVTERPVSNDPCVVDMEAGSFAVVTEAGNHTGFNVGDVVLRKYFILINLARPKTAWRDSERKVRGRRLQPGEVIQIEVG